MVWFRLEACHAVRAAVCGADHEQKLAVSKTDFADLWRRAVQHNPFVQAFLLNFGAIGELRPNTPSNMAPCAGCTIAVLEGSQGGCQVPGGQGGPGPSGVVHSLWPVPSHVGYCLACNVFVVKGFRLQLRQRHEPDASRMLGACGNKVLEALSNLAAPVASRAVQQCVAVACAAMSMAGVTERMVCSLIFLCLTGLVVHQWGSFCRCWLQHCAANGT